jgi:hypothetical protein
MDLLKLTMALLLAPVFSCTAGTNVVTDFVDAELSGQIDGQDWVYKHAYIDPTIRTPNEDDIVFIFLPYVPTEKCPRSPGDSKDQRSVMVAAPQQIKLVPIKAGTHRNLVFQYEDKNGVQIAKSAKKGKLKLLTMGQDKVVGKLYGRFSDSNWVSGNFSATVCNSLDLR